jgi:cell division protein YceG involved in septum cleavage
MFSHRTLVRILYILVLLLLILFTAGFSLLLESKQYVFDKFESIVDTEVVTETEPFPVSVDPVAQTITESNFISEYASESLAIEENQTDSFWDKVVALFFDKDWYQNLASPVGRIVVIWPGERKEEIAKNIGDVLGWDKSDKEAFKQAITTTEPVLQEGTFYPDKYVAHKDAKPDEVALLIKEQFKNEILNRYTSEVEDKVSLSDALTIASLLEREASDFENMREISGVIWNRLFIGMPLQLDATLQYVRGSRPTEKLWWPIPRPADKFLSSPYNTYQNAGLPPSPIGNPSAAAVLAALNPRETDCLFYFHDSKQGYHCSITYEEHVKKLKTAYGRGR